MPKPITPFVGCDVFLVDTSNRVLLIRRSDNGLWALPGGCQDLGETPAECAARECLEETGYEVRITRLLGVFSSQRYEYVFYPWKDNEFTHLLFQASLVAGSPATSVETSAVAFFTESDLPPLSDGHETRISHGFRTLREPRSPPLFE